MVAGVRHCLIVSNDYEAVGSVHPSDPRKMEMVLYPERALVTAPVLPRAFLTVEQVPE